MNLGTCHDCSAVGAFVNGLCRDCIEARNEAFRKARAYFSSNRGATARRCSEETGVPISLITSWINEGRLRAAVDPADQDLDADAREQRRQAEMRKAFAEKLGQMPAAAPAPAPTSTPSRGMYRKERS